MKQCTAMGPNGQCENEATHELAYSVPWSEEEQIWHLCVSCYRIIKGKRARRKVEYE
jgi:hypothetical protein